MHYGILVGRCKIGNKGQSSLAVVIPKNAVIDMGIKKGDYARIYRNPDLGENVLVVVIEKQEDFDM